MTEPIKIVTEKLSTSDGPGQIFDMTKRCAFALCKRGKIVIKILNENYVVEDHCMFACMPFVNIEVVGVDRPTEIVFGYIGLDDVPKMINRWVNTNNLLVIQQHPLIKLTDCEYDQLLTTIKNYLDDIQENYFSMEENIYGEIQRDVVYFHSMLVVARVLRCFYAIIQMELSGSTQRDVVFQQFMYLIYGNFREHRNVGFYAARSGLSLKYFSTLIRQISGSSPLAWIETVVVGEAKLLLKEPHRNIKEIAANLNFPDTPTFTKYFLRVTGQTPKAYRQSLPT